MIMPKQIIRCIRSGSAKWNEEDRLQLANLLIKAGYTVRVGYQSVPGDAKNRKEYIVEYWGDDRG